MSSCLYDSSMSRFVQTALFLLLNRISDDHDYRRALMFMACRKEQPWGCLLTLYRTLQSVKKLQSWTRTFSTTISEHETHRHLGHACRHYLVCILCTRCSQADDRRSVQRSSDTRTVAECVPEARGPRTSVRPSILLCSLARSNLVGLP